MTTVSATEARRRLYALIDEVGQSHEPVQITGKRHNAVLLSRNDWRAIQETLHLVSIPGMRESILEGMATAVSELSRARSRRINIQLRLVYQVLEKQRIVKAAAALGHDIKGMHGLADIQVAETTPETTVRQPWGPDHVEYPGRE